MAPHHRNHLRLEPVLDKTQPPLHVLPHLPVSLFQKASYLRGRLCRDVGDLRVVFIHIHLRAGREAVASGYRGPLRE